MKKNQNQSQKGDKKMSEGFLNISALVGGILLLFTIAFVVRMLSPQLEVQYKKYLIGNRYNFSIVNKKNSPILINQIIVNNRRTCIFNVNEELSEVGDYYEFDLSSTQCGIPKIIEITTNHGYGSEKFNIELIK